jgi:hypothetical protein
LKDNKEPLLLVDLEATLERRGNSDNWRRDRDTYIEVTSGQIQAVELVPPQFLDAFKSFEQTSSELERVSSQESGPNQTKRLTELADAGSRTLETMLASKADPQWTKRVSEFAANAQITRTFQRELLREWGGRFKRSVVQLGLQLHPPLPTLPKRCPVQELLIESKSPAEFLARIKSECPDGGLEEKLQRTTWAPEWTNGKQTGTRAAFSPRTLTALRVAELPSDEFETLRKQTKEAMDYQKSHPYRPASRPK